MSKKIVAIGGGENGRPLGDGKFAPYETELMDKEIIKLTGKKKPNFLFLAHSMSTSIEIQESYYQTMKKIYKEKLNCNCCDLKSNELENIESAKKKVEWADIIYEGGGDTLSMIKLWKKTGFDKLLYNAWNDGKVICGVSAGAVCWFKSCNSDSVGESSETEETAFSSVDCLNWIPAHLTPHCDEPGRYESTKLQLKENGLPGIMLSNCAALEILDNRYRIIASDCANRRKPYAIKAYWSDNNYKEESLTISNEFHDINELLDCESIDHKTY